MNLNLIRWRRWRRRDHRSVHASCLGRGDGVSATSRRRDAVDAAARECRSTQVDALRPHAQKLRVVLNKADQVTPQAVVEGLWSVDVAAWGESSSTPEVVRVHLGSFWDRPLDHRRGSDTALLSRERDDLLDELRNFPKNAV